MEPAERAPETRREYVLRRAREVKQYRKTAAGANVGYEWLCKLARGVIPNPGSDRIDRLFAYYQELEREEMAARELAEQQQLQPELGLTR